MVTEVCSFLPLRTKLEVRLRAGLAGGDVGDQFVAVLHLLAVDAVMVSPTFSPA